MKTNEFVRLLSQATGLSAKSIKKNLRESKNCPGNGAVFCIGGISAQTGPRFFLTILAPPVGPISHPTLKKWGERGWGYPLSPQEVCGRKIWARLSRVETLLKKFFENEAKIYLDD